MALVLAHSPACERNKEPILAVLREALAGARSVLELGSGTGQHAVHFARHLPHLGWQPSDLPEQLAGLAARVTLEGGENLRAPLPLDLRSPAWTAPPHDAVFTANTLHIIEWASVRNLFGGLPRVLNEGGRLCLYGPFRYAGAFTSESNARFDEDLRRRDPASGIRDFEAVSTLAAAAGLRLLADHDLPAHNRCLIWQRRHETVANH